jgi:hypothetical protein
LLLLVLGASDSVLRRSARFPRGCESRAATPGDAETTREGGTVALAGVLS